MSSSTALECNEQEEKEERIRDIEIGERKREPNPNLLLKGKQRNNVNNGSMNNRL